MAECWEEWRKTQWLLKRERRWTTTAGRGSTMEGKGGRCDGTGDEDAAICWFDIAVKNGKGLGVCSNGRERR
ncbi:hypothetical protein DF186_20825, partial [Enterococcus hirae]